LVSFVNKNRAGMSLEEACLEAGYTRLRPIWKNAITTLADLVPMAYGWGGVEPFVQPMARAMAWGLAFAMPFTLFLVPLGTLCVEDAKRGFARMLRRSSAKDHQPNDGQAADGL
jgi:hydrophobic/amphiphilic exporter-1 (mainly G- bacteria), HAE1 family